ncbi:hypothetical protein SKAU_G00032630 [Synaphobranchus kaupii]|uniref:Palmitoyltransferase n=1 Tax=Synaphobranchus kaupii TaxID=118154 RepID=A0A9Q1JFB0_SYNKA|nr:hypothetical protein SKAU_G00032630 [Synaphobranchus kaupii]
MTSFGRDPPVSKMAALRCRKDPCGFICLVLTYFSVFYADYVVIQYVLIPAYSGSAWCSMHGAIFNILLILLLACHSKAVFSDPGMVPLPDTAIDFSDLRSQSSRKNERGCEGWTVCSRCETYRPPRAHHCRVCQRCIRRMDHHCPWINNCVGELNQKYFIQFLFYTGLASLYSIALVVSAWVWRIRNERDGDEAQDTDSSEAPSKHLIVAHYIILLVESVLFGVFVMVIFYDQLISIVTDETPIEQMKNRLMKDRPSSSQHTHTTHTKHNTHTHTQTQTSTPERGLWKRHSAVLAVPLSIPALPRLGVSPTLLCRTMMCNAVMLVLQPKESPSH